MRKPHWLDILAAVYVLFVIYGSLIPFDVSLSAPASGAYTILGIPVTETGLPDILSNVALYFPLGLLVQAALHRRHPAAFLAIPCTLAFAVIVSFGMESAQVFLVSRVSSFADIVCNTIGAALGIVLSAPKTMLSTRMVPAIDRDLARNPTSVVAVAWLFAVIVSALAPLDVTIDVSTLVDGFEESHFTPFAKHQELIETAVLARQTMDPHLRFAESELWQLRLDYGADVFMFLILGVLLVRNMIAWGWSRASAQTISALSLVVFALSLTMAGFFVRSIDFDGTRVFTRAIGGVAGAVVPPLFVAGLFELSGAGLRDRRNPIGGLTAVALVTIAYIACRQLAPFRFEPGIFVDKVRNIEWLPLQSYSLAKLPAALIDVTHKSFRFVWLGALVASHRSALRQSVNMGHTLATGALVAVAVGVTECLQCLLPGRIPSVTDILLAGGATVVGVRIGTAFHQRYVRNTASMAPSFLNVELPAPDERPSQKTIKRSRRASVK